MHELVPGRGARRRDPARRRRHLRARHAGAAGAHAHRHGVPEAQPVPGDEHPRQRARRAEARAHQVRRQGRARRAVARSVRACGARCATGSTRPGGALSGGQQQRLCIARSLAVHPNVLLMDEPCSALDPTSTRRVEETIAELRGEVTVVIVTHNMQQAHRVSDTCAFFLAAENEPGRVVEQGSTEKMFSSPDDPADARLRDRTVRMSERLRRRRTRRRSLLVVARRGRATRTPPRGAAPARINGSGSTYVALAMQQWVADAQTSGLQVNYLPTGSPDGLTSYGNGLIDFAGHRGRVLGAHGRGRAARRRRAGYQYVPDVAGAIAVMYNVDDQAGRKVDYLHLSRRTIARIFTGDISNWSDPAITRRQQGPRAARPADHRRLPQRSVGDDRVVLRLRAARRARRLQPVGRAEPAPDQRAHHPARRRRPASRRRRSRSSGSDQIAQSVASGTAASGRSPTTSSATRRPTACPRRGCRTRRAATCSRTPRTSRPRSSRRRCGPTSARSCRGVYDERRTRSPTRSRPTATSSRSARARATARRARAPYSNGGRHRDAGRSGCATSRATAR